MSTGVALVWIVVGLDLGMLTTIVVDEIRERHHNRRRGWFSEQNGPWGVDAYQFWRPRDERRL